MTLLFVSGVAWVFLLLSPTTAIRALHETRHRKGEFPYFFCNGGKKKENKKKRASFLTAEKELLG